MGSIWQINNKLSMKFPVTIFCICLLLIACNGSKNKDKNSIAETPAVATTASSGERLFTQKCFQCHRCNTDMTGPPLKGSQDRWKDKKNLFDFVRNSQEVIKKDSYAADLFKRYNETYMNPFPELTDAEIQSILDYCK